MEQRERCCREAAFDYIRRGWAPIPVRQGQKAPIPKDWPKTFLRAADIPTSFSNHENVGILLGHYSGGLVDIDLDSREAILLAPFFLPKTTAIFGRPSKPRSHWLYLPETELANSKFRDTEGNVLVEIRSTGLQTVFPPSFHSKEQVAWTSEGEPMSVDGNILRPKVAELAAAALAASHWPDQGSRQETALALAGALSKQGWSEFRVEHFIRIVAQTAGDEEARKRSEAGQYTQKRMKAGQSVTGWTRLKTLIGSDVVKLLKTWLANSGCEDPKRTESFSEANSSPGTANKKTQQPQSHAQILIAMAENAELFHTPDGNGYATFPVREHRETWSINSKAFRGWLARIFYEKFQRPPGREVLKDVCDLLESRALYDAKESPVFVRVAQLGEAIYLDLGNAEWETVEVTRTGWRIVSNPPVWFRRTNAMRASPRPIKGGSIEELRSVINAQDDKTWILLVGWLIGALRPTGPYLILALQGETGTAKSTTAKMLSTILDPSAAPLRSVPANEADLMIAARNSWVLSFDNLSGISSWLSDALCRLATGGGLSKRQLFADDDEIILEATRPSILNGIDDLAAREDLAERCVSLVLSPVSGENRRTERELWDRFEIAHPRILGSVLDAVSSALKNIDEAEMQVSPRMSDAVEWITAAEEGLSWTPRSFQRSFEENQKDGVAICLETDLVASAISRLIEEQRRWEGTGAELLTLLNSQISREMQRSKAWPTSPRGLGGRVRRVAPVLRKAGIEIEFFREPGTRRRLILIRPHGLQTGPTVPNSSTTQAAPLKRDDWDGRNASQSNLQPADPEDSLREAETAPAREEIGENQ